MRLIALSLFAGLPLALALAGCSGGDGSGFTTAALGTQQVAAKPSVDPACTTLAAQISAARQEGTPAKVHAVATGTTKSVRVKRASLAKVAELDRLNGEFQAACSTVPVPRTAAIAPAAAAATPAGRPPARSAAAVTPPPASTRVAAGTPAPPASTTPIVAVPQ